MRTSGVAFSGQRAWIACLAASGTWGNLNATAALTTLRITSTVSPPIAPLLVPRQLPSSWRDSEQRPPSPVPSASGCPSPAPSGRTTQPALARSSPPSTRIPAAPGPLLFCRCIPSDCAPGHLAAPSTVYLNHRHLSLSPGPGCFLSYFLPLPLCPPPLSALHTPIPPFRRHQPAKPSLHRPPNQPAPPNPLLIESRPSESLT